MTQVPTIAKPAMLTYNGKTAAIVNRMPQTIGLMIPAIRPRPEAVPTAVPRTSVSNTSGV